MSLRIDPSLVCAAERAGGTGGAPHLSRIAQTRVFYSRFRRGSPLLAPRVSGSMHARWLAFLRYFPLLLRMWLLALCACRCRAWQLDAVWVGASAARSSTSPVHIISHQSHVWLIRVGRPLRERDRWGRLHPSQL